jgi:hypothetical protein
MLAPEVSGEIEIDDAVRKVQQARRRVAQVRRALGSQEPGELNACVPVLNEVIGCLGEMQAWGEKLLRRDPGLARELEALRFDSGVVRRMIEGGSRFYQGWARMLAIAAAGYTPSGEPAALTAPGSVSYEA